jgi:hypothetical protein
VTSGFVWLSVDNYTDIVKMSLTNKSLMREPPLVALNSAQGFVIYIANLPQLGDL